MKASENKITRMLNNMKVPEGSYEDRLKLIEDTHKVTLKIHPKIC